MSELTTVARPYAKAAFDFAVEHQAVSKWQEMLAFTAAVVSDSNMYPLINGALAAEKLADLLINVCGEQIDQSGQNLIKVMAENKRLLAMPEVSQLFDLFKAEYDKEIEVDVKSAVELSDAQKSNLETSLEKRLARKVKLICNVDSALVAGMVIKAGDTVIDGSVKSKLNRLADALQA